MPGNGYLELPLASHIVVRDEALAAVMRAQGIGAFQSKLNRRQIDAVRELLRGLQRFCEL